MEHKTKETSTRIASKTASRRATKWRLKGLPKKEKRKKNQKKMEDGKNIKGVACLEHKEVLTVKGDDELRRGRKYWPR